MSSCRRLGIGALLVWCVCVAESFAAEDVVATKAFAVLVKRCAACHGKVSPEKGLSVLDYAYMTGDKKIVVPKDLGNSKMWQKVALDKDDTMPPGGRLPDDELAILREWIERGAPDFIERQATRRPFVSTEDIFRSVLDDLRKHEAFDREFLRYYSIAHLHNNPAFADADLRKFQAALSKLINSVSWKRSIHVPVAIDPQTRTVFRIDLRDLGWNENQLWRVILSHYPYGLTYETSHSERLRKLAEEVYKEVQTELPVIRADWFIATASVPPLYHQILQLPRTDVELEKRLGVDFRKDFENNKLRRAGFVQSNVSKHNRLVDRHESHFGAYWKSYDFRSSAGQGDLTLRPLGPNFPSNENKREAFVHDGGEIIFNLPNGLQGYMITDGKGTRIDSAPTDVVEDTNRAKNSPSVINGLSCMVCHKNGMRHFKDALRSGHGVKAGTARLKIDRLFAPQEEMDRLLAKDDEVFQRALEQAIGPFVRVGSELKKPIVEFGEPVSAIVKQYFEDLDFDDVASELSFADSGANLAEKNEELKTLFKSLGFRDYGVSVLFSGSELKRDAWEARTPYSRYQEVSEKLGIGIPMRVRVVE